MIHTVTDASEIRHGPVPKITCPPMPISQRDVTSRHGEGVRVDRPSLPLIAVADGTVTAQSTRPAQQSSTARPCRSSKSKARKKRRLHKEKESALGSNQLANDTDGPPPADVATPCHEQPQTSVDCSLTTVSDSYPKSRQVTGHTNGEASIQEDCVIALSRENNHGNTMAVPREAGVPALQLKAGVLTQRVRRLMVMLLDVNFTYMLGGHFHCPQ